jgi:hypothetical protein
MERDVLVMKK